MSNYIKQEFDFIDRTGKILEQYNKLNLKESYGVTLLLNCSVGLLVLPQQFWFEHLPTEIINKEKWGLSEDMISFITKNEVKSVKNVSRHLRNSISHYKFETIGNDNNNIERIKFEDFDTNGNKTFEMLVKVIDYKIFLQKFSKGIMDVVNSLK